MPNIRPYRPSDLDDLYRICLLTANNGEDATSLYSDPQLPGHVFAAPYGVLEPSLAFIAEHDHGQAAGYIVGARDSQDFERRMERDWWPKLRGRYPLPPKGLPQENWTRDQLAAQAIERHWTTPDELAARYPSHLHINLLPPLQGHGMGRRMIETLTTALRDQGSPGVHLHVNPGNQRAAAFYRHVGFTELPSQGPHLFVLDL